MRGWFATLLCLSGSGCNLVLGLDEPVAGDAAVADDASDLDAPLGRFDNPVPVTVTPAEIENDPVVTADEQEALLIVGTATVPYDIFRATITNGVWGTPEPLLVLSSAVTDGFLRFGRDDTIVFLASDRAGGLGGLDIYRSTRPDRMSTAWTTPELITALSSPASDRTPAPCADDTRFVLPSDRDGVLQLYEYDAARMPVPVAFTVPLEMPRAPFLTDDCLTMYVTGTVSGDLYVLQRDTLDAPWSEPVPLTELNTAGSESDTWLSDDGHHIVFSRDGDIWEAFR